jgi:hypothetical protein
MVRADSAVAAGAFKLVGRCAILTRFCGSAAGVCFPAASPVEIRRVLLIRSRVRTVPWRFAAHHSQSRGAVLRLLRDKRRNVVLLPRQAIEVRRVTERAIIRFGDLKSHHTVRDVGPSDGAIEAAKSIRHEKPGMYCASDTSLSLFLQHLHQQS